MECKENKTYAGIDMSNWDFSYKDGDENFIYKAFIAVCNFAEEISGCAECPMLKLCFSKDRHDGDKFWEHVHKKLNEIRNQTDI